MAAPIRRIESVFDGADRIRLVRRGWHGDPPERAVALVHGFGEHSARYDEMGAWLAERGCAVHAYDHRGHGLSDGLRNHVRHFDEYTADLGHFLAAVKAEHPEVPLALVGHSMGGLVVARALVTASLPIDCAVTSGAALAVSESLSRGKQRAARLLAKIAPRLRSSSGLPTDGLSRDPEVVRRYEADPLVDTDMTMALGAAMLSAQAETAGAGERVPVPLLGLHGADDPICPSSGTERFLEAVRVPGSACKVYPGLRHEIFNEPEREQVWGDVLSFLREVGSRAP